MSLFRRVHILLYALPLCISSSSMSHSPVFGVTAFVMPKGKWVYQFKDIFWDRDDGREAIALLHTLAYGLTNRLTAEFSFNYLMRQTGNLRSSGIGDLTVRLNYDLYTRKTKYDTFRLIAQNLVRFPTGDPLAIPPLGFGTYRDRIGLGIDYDATQYGIYNAMVYEFNLSTFQGFQAGNLFEATLTLEAKPSANTAFVTEIDFYTLGKDTFNGVEDPASGGTILYAGPTIHYQNEYFKVAGAFQVPVFRNNLNLGFRGGFLINFYF